MRIAIASVKQESENSEAISSGFGIAEVSVGGIPMNEVHLKRKA